MWHAVPVQERDLDALFVAIAQIFSALGLDDLAGSAQELSARSKTFAANPQGLVDPLRGLLAELEFVSTPVSGGQTASNALESWVARSLGSKRRKYAVPLSRRLGFGTIEAWTLEQAGASCGVTRERIRQVESALLQRLPSSDPPYDVLERILDEIASMTPADVNDVRSALDRAGTSIDVVRFLRVCRVVGIGDVPQVVNGTLGMVGSEAERHHALHSAVIRGWRDFDLRHVTQLERQVRKQVVDATATEVRKALDGSTDVKPLGAGWYLRTSSGSLSGLRKLPATGSVVLTTLSVCGPMPAETLWKGIIRSARRQNLSYPELAPFKTFLELLGLLAEPDGWARLPDGMPARKLLRQARLLAHIIGIAPDHIVTYGQIRRTFVNAGLTAASASQAIEFSPILMRVGRNQWTLRQGNLPEHEGRAGAESGQPADPALAAEILAARKTLRLSQRALGERLGTNQPTISNYERGRWSVPTSVLQSVRQLLKESAELRSATGATDATS